MADELQAVRSRVGSYFDTSGNMRNQCVLNSLCLVMSSIRMGEPVSKIEIVASGDRFSVTDDGPGLLIVSKNGIPSATEYMTELKACHRHPGHAGLEDRICGHGLATVNAISSTARVVTGTGIATMQKFSVGRPMSAPSETKAELKGTRFDFELDKRSIGGPAFDLGKLEVDIASIGVSLDGVTVTVKDS